MPGFKYFPPCLEQFALEFKLELGGQGSQMQLVFQYCQFFLMFLVP